MRADILRCLGLSQACVCADLQTFQTGAHANGADLLPQNTDTKGLFKAALANNADMAGPQSSAAINATSGLVPPASSSKPVCAHYA